MGGWLGEMEASRQASEACKRRCACGWCQLSHGWKGAALRLLMRLCASQPSCGGASCRTCRWPRHTRSRGAAASGHITVYRCTAVAAQPCLVPDLCISWWGGWRCGRAPAAGQPFAAHRPTCWSWQDSVYHHTICCTVAAERSCWSGAWLAAS